jgi:hypothetical protein
LKNKLQEYNSKYHLLDIKQKQLKALIIFDDEMEFDEPGGRHDDDDEERRLVEKKSKDNRSRLDQSGNEIQKQNDKLHDTLKIGH